MVSFLVAFDLWARKFLTAFCVLMLFMMVVFTVYTVIMRYVFWNPPMWGDLVTVLSNIWFVFLRHVVGFEHEPAILPCEIPHLPVSTAHRRYDFPPINADDGTEHTDDHRPKLLDSKANRCWQA